MAARGLPVGSAYERHTTPDVGGMLVGGGVRTEGRDFSKEGREDERAEQRAALGEQLLEEHRTVETVQLSTSPNVDSTRGISMWQTACEVSVRGGEGAG
jgi:hypothetical protein